MAFTVEDFQDFVRLLAQHPEWRPELRRLVLSDDLLELPALVRELVAAQQRTEERVGRLDERVGRLEEAVTALAEAQRQTEERVGRLEAAVTALVEAQRRTDERIVGLIEAQMRTDRRLPSLSGYVLERRYHERGASYFAPILRRIRVLRPDQVADLLEAGVEAGALSEDDADEIRWADVIARGQRRDTGEEAYLVVEVSVTVDQHDVERAFDRAALLSRYRAALAAVAGDEITAGAEALAERRGVWRLLDGRPTAPAEA